MKFWKNAEMHAGEEVERTMEERILGSMVEQAAAAYVAHRL